MTQCNDCQYCDKCPPLIRSVCATEAQGYWGTFSAPSTRYSGMRPAADEHVNVQIETTDLFTHELHTLACGVQKGSTAKSLL